MIFARELINLSEIFLRYSSFREMWLIIYMIMNFGWNIHVEKKFIAQELFRIKTDFIFPEKVSVSEAISSLSPLIPLFRNYIRNTSKNVILHLKAYLFFPFALRDKHEPDPEILRNAYSETLYFSLLSSTSTAVSRNNSTKKAQRKRSCGEVRQDDTSCYGPVNRQIH